MLPLLPSIWSKESQQLSILPSLFPPEEHETVITPVHRRNLENLSTLECHKRKFLNKHYLPMNWKREGIEEFPVNLPYTGSIPDFLVGTSTKHDGYHPNVGLHNFTYDHVNERWWHNIDKFIDIASHYSCVLGLDFSVLVNGARCDVVEAIRRNRTFTASLQASGVNTIQSACFGHPKHNKFVFDGLAYNAPTAIEHMRTSRDLKQQKYFRCGVDALVEQKNPSILLVVGFELGFDPGVPVKYYPCHIQYLRGL